MFVQKLMTTVARQFKHWYNISDGSPGDTARELSKALVEGQQLSESCEAVADHRCQVAHIVHQQALHTTSWLKQVLALPEAHAQLATIQKKQRRATNSSIGSLTLSMLLALLDFNCDETLICQNKISCG